MKKKGFTLVELMVVIAIIGLLASITLPKFTKVTDSAKAAQVQANLVNLRTAVQMFHAKSGMYPNINNNNKDKLHTVVKNGVRFTDFYSKSRIPDTPNYHDKLGGFIDNSNNIDTCLTNKGKPEGFHGEGGWLFTVHDHSDNNGEPSYTGHVFANVSAEEDFDPFDQNINWLQF